jgi:NAD(P)-dependent dehydrogenase (short-subunit alcohol dehydrogenase family)
MAQQYTSLLDFQGKLAVVTGAAQGLGAEFARALAECGATVVLMDVVQAAVEAAARQIGSHAHAIECDVRDKARVEQCIADVIATHGQIDILVSNAGIHRRVDPLDFNEDDVEAIFAVNMKGCLNVCGAVGRFMVERGSGSIVNISALGGGLAGLGRAGSAYGMSKGGIVSLTRDLAAEWTRHGVRVNAVAPGWIRTPMTTALQSDVQRSAAVLQRVPAGRWGEPVDVARVVLFLASDASSYLSGHTIPVDGGALNTITLPSS